MSEQEMHSEIDGTLLAQAFSSERRPEAILAGEAAARGLAPRQWTERFSVQAEGQRVLIPSRLRFVSSQLGLTENDKAWPFVRALQTRSTDGFERQRAVRDLLPDLEPWAAPFVVALIGEYIVEILEDISAAMTPEHMRTLGSFVTENEAYWSTTKRRVASYWNVYYRSNRGWGTRRGYSKDEYIGFKLISSVERAAFGNA